MFVEKTSEQYYDEENKQFLADRYIIGTCPKCSFEKAYGDQCESCGTSLSPTELINPTSTISGNQPVLKETTAVRMDVSHSAWSDIFFLGMDYPEGARVIRWKRFARYNGPNADAAIEEYAAIAEKAGLNLAQMCLAWVNQRVHVASNLIGATTMEQLKENIGSIDVKLSDEVLKEIEAVHQLIPNPAP